MRGRVEGKSFKSIAAEGGRRILPAGNSVSLPRWLRVLPKIDRIDVDGDRNIVRERKGGQDFAEPSTEFGHSRNTEHELVAVVGLGAEERRGRRAGDDQVFEIADGFGEFLFQVVGGEFDFFLIASS